MPAWGQCALLLVGVSLPWEHVRGLPCSSLTFSVPSMSLGELGAGLGKCKDRP